MNMAKPSARPRPLLAQAIRRRHFLAGGAAALAAAVAASFGADPALAALRAPGAAPHAERACCPTRIAAPPAVPAVTLEQATQGNAQAILLAARSRIVGAAADATLQMAQALPNPDISAATVAILQDPAPTYQLRSPTAADKTAVRQDLLAAGLIPERTTVEGIFPPVADPNLAPQMFWSAPGSTYSGHHSSPGGLVIHEWVNASLARAFLDIYDAAYGLVSNSAAIDYSIAQAAPLWHDIHKVTVFQWNPNGSEFAEQVIADTGAHHPLSGAEAIVRGMPPAFVIALLSAHDAPTTVNTNPDQTGLQRLTNYVRAAAIIARVDPVAAGLLRLGSDGAYSLNQNPPRVEGFINHLSDHDFLFSGDSAALMIRTLRQIAADYGINPEREEARFNLFRNLVFSQVPDMRLYGVFQTGGVAAVKATIDREVDLSQL
jgi:hypothetical protein